MANGAAFTELFVAVARVTSAFSSRLNSISKSIANG